MTQHDHYILDILKEISKEMKGIREALEQMNKDKEKKHNG